MFEKISKKIGFTETEIVVILFLAALFIIGFVYVEFLKDNDDKGQIYVDYSGQDSLFALYSNINSETITGDSSQVSNLEIKKQVLELSDTFKYIKKDIASLTEKSIDINSAGIDDLIRLPGIGEKTADKIIELRTEKGKFNQLEELMEVKGIGEVKFNKIKKFLYIK